MKKLLLLFTLFFLFGCETQDVPTGHKGFIFDRTGVIAFYSGGHGVEEDTIKGPGSHYVGIYDKVVGVNCQDAHVKEQLPVLTKSDMKVTVDLRVTYAADCSSKESLLQVVDQVQRGKIKDSEREQPFVQPEDVFEKYIMPVIRESLRNHLADVTIEEVKSVRGDLSRSIREDLAQAIKEKDFPVRIELLTVSDITLPPAITSKIKEIEVARMEANKEAEKQRAAKVRLERELFEAEQERRVEREKSLKKKDVKKIKAEADLEVQKLKAQGILEIRRQITPAYVEYLRLLKGAEVQTRMAEAMDQGTVYYLGESDFLVPPNLRINHE